MADLPDKIVVERSGLASPGDRLVMGAGGSNNMRQEPDVDHVEVQQDPDLVHPPTLDPQPPMFISQVVSGFGTLVTTYGWLLVALCAVCLLLRSRLRPVLKQWMRKREQDRESALHHKNPEIVIAREAAMEAARRKMQERYSEDSRAYAEQEKERRRLQKTARQQTSSTGRALATTAATVNKTAATVNKTDKPVKKKPTFKTDYNPLMGSGGSCSYRPARRGGAAGGG